MIGRRKLLIRALDNALPRAVARDLRRRVIASMPFRGTIWYPLDRPPRTVFEQAIHHLRALTPGAKDAIAAEWWIRAAPSESGHRFHFDRDEALLDVLVTPEASSILYLSDTGGPTIVTDTRARAPAAPRRAVAVSPHLGRYVVFPGDLYHGVLPGSPSRWPRVVMLMNWWAHSVAVVNETIPRRMLANGCPTMRRFATQTIPHSTVETFDATELLPTAVWTRLLRV
jgi:hypothetical protein